MNISNYIIVENIQISIDKNISISYVCVNVTVKRIDVWYMFVDIDSSIMSYRQ